MAKLRQETIRRKSPVTSCRKEVGHKRTSSSDSSSTMAEMVGGTTAGCAAIACCAPYGVANLVVLVVYKVPAGLCRKAIRRHRRRRLMKTGAYPVRTKSDDMTEMYEMADVMRWSEGEVMEVEVVTEEEFKELEKEMWAHFSSTGFWRSPSMKPAV